jgi:hypothetical protein
MPALRPARAMLSSYAKRRVRALDVTVKAFLIAKEGTEDGWRAYLNAPTGGLPFVGLSVSPDRRWLLLRRSGGRRWCSRSAARPAICLLMRFLLGSTLNS